MGLKVRKREREMSLGLGFIHLYTAIKSRCGGGYGEWMVNGAERSQQQRQ